MILGRRGFLGAAAAASLPLGGVSAQAASPAVTPIGRDERLKRITKAQALMRRHGLEALLIEPGSSMVYFTGVRWWLSERVTAAILPVEGEACIVTPHFEEPSVRQTLGIPAEVRVWHEDRNPMEVVAGFLKDRKLAGGPIGVEERVRYFVVEGLMKALPGVQVRPGAPVVRGCRMIKTAPEIALMQRANDITLAAMTEVHGKVARGMTRDDIAKMIDEATERLGGNADGALVLVGEASAYPHGSRERQVVQDGSVVLMDCGCTVEDYTSDISRTFIFGEPSKHQRQVWDQVRQGQAIAFAAAQVGRPCGSVDDAVRASYERLGYGPGYKLPGLSHRTGHGIGMDGHEPVNLVHGETTPLAEGMCFSDEPGIYIPGQFGVRLEDCFHMTPAGPKWFTVPPTSIDRPFG